MTSDQDLRGTRKKSKGRVKRVKFLTRKKRKAKQVTLATKLSGSPIMVTKYQQANPKPDWRTRETRAIIYTAHYKIVIVCILRFANAPQIKTAQLNRTTRRRGI